MGAVRPAEVPAFPSADDLGETLLHFAIRSLLVEVVRRWLAERGEQALVGSDQFVYWVPTNPQRTVAPDLYLLRGVDPDRDVTSWQVWNEGGRVPALAIEVVSEDMAKDYLVGPRRYGELGVEELLIYDPAAGSSAARVRWQVYRRRDGELVQEIRTDADRVWSEVLGCFLREVGTGPQIRVRVASGAHGELLFPTAAEAERAERAEKEAERAEKEAERQARLGAEAEVAVLRAALERLNRGGEPRPRRPRPLLPLSHSCG